MTNKLLIFDKDGTLTTTKSGKTFVQHPTDQILLPNVAETIARYAADGWTMAIASNQGGVAAGYKSLEEAIAEMQYCSQISGVDHILFCPDFEGNYCVSVSNNRFCRNSKINQVSVCFSNEKYWVPELDFAGYYRKPDAGMLKVLMALHKPDQSIYIGDRPEDQSAAIAAGVPFRWASEFFGGG